MQPNECQTNSHVALDAPISKSQLKKLAKRQKWLESKGERRKLEKEKKKLKRRTQAEQQQQQQCEPQLGGSSTLYKRPKLMAESSNKFKIVIDMDFEDYMTDSEIAKSAQQVGRIYAANRYSDNPCQLYVTSLKGKIKDRFAITNAGYLNWDINHSELNYESLFKDSLKEEEANSNRRFVYLSGDSSDTMPDVDTMLRDESKIFIIGGLVDHNRHKGLCHKRALERNIPTAKLPIKEHVNLCQRHILSTVTVFEIMLQVLGSHKQWPEALLAAIPKRKIAQQSQQLVDKTEDQVVNDTKDCDRKEANCDIKDKTNHDDVNK